MGSKPSDTGKASRKVLLNTTNEIRNASRGGRDAYFNDLSSAIRTGGVNANVPILNTALEGSKYGQATALADSQKSLDRAGIGGSTGSGIIADAAQTGGRATSSTRQAIVQQFLQAAPSAALGQTQQATSTLEGIAARGAQGQIAGQQQQQALLGSGAAAGGAVVGAIIIAI